VEAGLYCPQPHPRSRAGEGVVPRAPRRARSGVGRTLVAGRASWDPSPRACSSRTVTVY
jgi:hypothetical protein